MLRLYFSNRLETLASELARQTSSTLKGAQFDLAPHFVAVPNRRMAGFLEFSLARETPIAANIRVTRWGALLRQWIGSTSVVPLLDVDAIKVSAIRHFFEHEPPAQSYVARYLDSVGTDPSLRDQKKIHAALKLADTFAHYAAYRPEWLIRWIEGGHIEVPSQYRFAEQGQSLVWRAIDAILNPLSGQSNAIDTWSWVALGQNIARTMRTQSAWTAANARSPALHVFGFSHMPRGWLYCLQGLAQEVDVYIYTLNPCREFWEDIRTPTRMSQLAHLTQTSLHDNDSEHGVQEQHFDDDCLALALWSRTGREFIQALLELTQGDFVDLFSDADDNPVDLLSWLQHDLLERAPMGMRLDASTDAMPEKGSRVWIEDESLAVVACADVRSEVQQVAEAITRIMQQHEHVGSISFRDFVVYVASHQIAEYRLHVEAILNSAYGIPLHIVDVSTNVPSAWRDAARALISAPLGVLSAHKLSHLLTSPVFFQPGAADRDTLVDIERWRSLLRRSGVTESDFLTDEPSDPWPRALLRLGLSQWMRASMPSQVGLASSLGVLEPEAAANTFDLEAAQLLTSLVADLKIAQQTKCKAGEWFGFIVALLQTYLEVANREHDEQRRQLLRAIDELAEHPWGDVTLPYAAIAELVLNKLDDTAFESAIARHDAVSVMPLDFMQVTPRPYIFVMGLSDDMFPSQSSRSSLDLTSAKRTFLDLASEDADKYAFLECILSARARLTLSFVAQASEQGQARDASPLLKQLVGVVRAAQIRTSKGRMPLPPKASSQVPRDQLALFGKVHQGSAPVAFGGQGARSAPAHRSAYRRDESTVSSVDITDLKQFMRDPAKAWLQRILMAQAKRPNEDPAERRPEVVSLAQRGRILAHALFDASRQRLSANEFYLRWVDRLKDNAEWPTESFSRMLVAYDLERLESFERYLVLRLGGVSDLRPQRSVLGATSHPLGFDHTLEPLAIPLPLHGKVTTVMLGGQLEPMDMRTGSGFSFSYRVPPRKPEREAFFLTRAMNAYVDHLIWSAQDNTQPLEREWVCFGGTPDLVDVTFRFNALSKADAIRQLTLLIEDYLTKPHDYFFPADAAAASVRDVMHTPEQISEVLTQAYDNQAGWRWWDKNLLGHLRMLSASEAEHLWQRRYQAFFQALKQDGHD